MHFVLGPSPFINVILLGATNYSYKGTGKLTPIRHIFYLLEISISKLCFILASQITSELLILISATFIENIYHIFNENRYIELVPMFFRFILADAEKICRLLYDFYRSWMMQLFESWIKVDSF